MNEFIEQFLIEARELVALATDDLLALEAAPGNAERLDSAFRAFHTLKGSAGIIGFPAMEHALHAAEEVLSGVRNAATPVTPALISHCLTALDQVVQWLDVIEETGEPPPAAEAERAAEKLASKFASEPAKSDAPNQADPAAESPANERLSAVGQSLLQEQVRMLSHAVGDGAAGTIASAARVAENILRREGLAQESLEFQRLRAAGDVIPLVEALAKALAGTLNPTPVQDPTGQTPTAEVATALRVDVSRVDALVRLTGELIVAKNGVGHLVGLAQSGADLEAVALGLKNQHALLERLVGELQRSVLAIRVLPLRHAFQRFPRLIRDISASVGKPVRLTIEGEETEADKAIVEALFEPLLHVIRNAIDHGLELPKDRTAAGKIAAGSITLRAARQGDRVVVEISDDGAGLNLARIREVAATRGVASEDALAAMSDREVGDLIFAPGFSTATTVTGISGRGVGMDSVRSAVERMGGRVTVESKFGLGATVRFTLPFTVMMSRVLTVEAGAQSYGIPMEAVVETVRVPRAAITAIGAARAFVLRNRTLPLLGLADTLEIADAHDRSSEATIVVADAEGQLIGLEVDRVGAGMDVMLKPLEGLLSGMPGMAGTTLLGDGRVLIVLDLTELID